MLQCMPNLKKCHLYDLKTASNVDTVVAAVKKKIGRGSQKSDQIFDCLFSSALKICAETKIPKYQHDCLE